MVLKVVNPYSGEVVSELEYDEGEQLEQKIARASEAQRGWRALSVGDRVRRVEAALMYFREASDEIARDVTVQMGKPITEARREVDGMLGRADHMLSIAEEALAPELLPAVDRLHRRIEHEPLGVVLNLAAWNYPLLIAVNVVVPALLAGNTVLLKHSARTPLCGDHFERAFAGLGAGLCANLVLTHEQTARVIGDERVGHVAFTGSVEGGRAVYQEVSRRFIDAGLELGGTDPAYVAEDADLEAAVAGVVDGACYNAGQSCCAVERAYVHESLHAEFLRRAEELMRGYVLGDPLDERTTMGPMVSSSAVEFVAAQVADAVSGGARAVVGGSTEHEGRFFQPTLLADCAQRSAVVQEESFGPVLPVVAVADDDEALRHMNDSRFGLTASVWTRDRDRAERFARELETGTVYQNRCDSLDPGLPWTGVKDSGKGSTLSRFGFLHLTRRKSLNFVSS